MPGELPNPTGRDWLKAFLEAQGQVSFHALWMTFAIGQSGVMMEMAKRHPEHRADAREMVEQMTTDARDLSAATRELNGVVADILANAKRNLEELPEE